MENTQQVQIFIEQLSVKIEKIENQWKGSRFASANDSDSDSEGEDDDFGNYQQFMEKYRGKNGDLKPLGLVIYRKFLRSLIILFLILTLCSLPVALVYSSGGGIADFQKSASFSKSILLFSIANLPRHRFDNLTSQDLNTMQCYRFLAIGTDVLSILIILGFLLYWKIISADLANHYAAKSPSPHLYCLKISNIEGKNQKQLKQHFSKFGKVAQISSIRSDGNLLIDLAKMVKLVIKFKHAGNTGDANKQKKIYDRIQKYYIQLIDIYSKKPAPKLKQCFLCYEQISVRNKVADLYKYDILPQKLSFDDIKAEEIPESNDKKIENMVQPIVKKYKFEPLTLNWENFDINKCSQIMKNCFQALLLIIMLFMILIALFLLNINSSHVKEQYIDQANNSSSNSFDFESINFQQIQKQSSNSRLVYTFCASLTYSTFKWEYYDLCSNYFNTERNKFALMLIFSLLVATINLLTNRILWALVAFKRYETLAERNRFLIKSIFMFSLINSAILILFIREQHIGPILRRIVSNIFGFSEEEMRVTVYPEFNRQWYLNIGNQLMMNYVVSLILFPHFHIFLHWARKQYRRIMAKKKNKVLNDPNFNYCTFYAMALKAIFFAMIYSASMPVFFFLCFLALNVQLYIGKFLLKKFVKQPVFVDNNAIEVASELIPYSLLLHCLTSILFLGVDEIFPTQDSYFQMGLNFQERNIRRLQRGSIYIVMSILITTFIWHQRNIYEMVVEYWLGRDQSKIQCDLKMKFSELQSNPAFLSSYKMKDNPKYKILFHALTYFQEHLSKLKKLQLEECESLDSQPRKMQQYQEEEEQDKQSYEILKNQTEIQRNQIIMSIQQQTKTIHEQTQNQQSPQILAQDFTENRQRL